jgi:hypothetical protein
MAPQVVIAPFDLRLNLNFSQRHSKTTPHVTDLKVGSYIMPPLTMIVESRRERGTWPTQAHPLLHQPTVLVNSMQLELVGSLM